MKATLVNVSVIPAGESKEIPGLTGKTLDVLDIHEAVIFEDGTVNKKPSLLLCAHRVDGSVTAMKTTGEIAKTLGGIFESGIFTDCILSAPDENGVHVIHGKKVSDGYHTFDELYEHRIQLYITLTGVISLIPQRPYIWKSKRHSDGELAFGGGWFVLGIGTNVGEQITYHLPEKYWEQTPWAKELSKAPDFDGHTADDVLTRLKRLVSQLA